jgi:hypothetical protein
VRKEERTERNLNNTMDVIFIPVEREHLVRCGHELRNIVREQK